MKRVFPLVLSGLLFACSPPPGPAPQSSSVDSVTTVCYAHDEIGDLAGFYVFAFPLTALETQFTSLQVFQISSEGRFSILGESMDGVGNINSEVDILVKRDSEFLAPRLGWVLTYNEQVSPVDEILIRLTSPGNELTPVPLGELPSHRLVRVNPEFAAQLQKTIRQTRSWLDEHLGSKIWTLEKAQVLEERQVIREVNPEDLSFDQPPLKISFDPRYDLSSDLSVRAQLTRQTPEKKGEGEFPFFAFEIQFRRSRLTGALQVRASLILREKTDRYFDLSLEEMKSQLESEGELKTLSLRSREADLNGDRWGYRFWNEKPL